MHPGKKKKKASAAWQTHAVALSCTVSVYQISISCDFLLVGEGERQLFVLFAILFFFKANSLFAKLERIFRLAMRIDSAVCVRVCSRRVRKDAANERTSRSEATTTRRKECTVCVRSSNAGSLDGLCSRANRSIFTNERHRHCSLFSRVRVRLRFGDTLDAARAMTTFVCKRSTQSAPLMMLIELKWLRNCC